MTSQKASEKVNIVLCGASGQMGRRLIQLISSSPSLELTGAVEHKDCPFLGHDAGSLAGVAPLGVVLTDDFTQGAKGAQVYLDFSSPRGVGEHVLKAAQLSLAAVIGVTALGTEVEEKLKEAAKKIALLYAPNMSFGMNLMYKIAAEVATLLGKDYNIEIVEAHHNRKKDAPSGTALMLYEKLKAARGITSDVKKLGRSNVPGPRTSEEIGIHAVRGGDIVGDHQVIYAGPGEVLEIVHRAQSRDAFVTGALRACQWIIGKPPGLYNFSEVLGI
ncbi:MAG: 4-hydroxy-tetrahydrodipicolinate reductase [Deltaproteobacteria bacterium]|nr:4-hydroxy-tetrahydrodipicolinate reductase [Deltaproteobacteria bacterium]